MSNAGINTVLTRAFIILSDAEKNALYEKTIFFLIAAQL